MSDLADDLADDLAGSGALPGPRLGRTSTGTGIGKAAVGVQRVGQPAAWNRLATRSVLELLAELTAVELASQVDPEGSECGSPSTQAQIRGDRRKALRVNPRCHNRPKCEHLRRHESHASPTVTPVG